MKEPSFNNRTILLSESPTKLMISQSFPAILGMIVVGLYSFMDAVFVGNLVGKTAMTATSVAFPFTLLNNGISTLIGIGSASILSRAIGRKDKEIIEHIMGNMIALVSIFSLLLTVLGITFTRPLLMMAGAESKVLDGAVRYLRIIFIGAVFVNFALAANMMMRGAGELKKAMLYMAVGAVINIVLDPIFIILFRDSGKGLEAAAFATISAQFLQAAITLRYFIRESKDVKIKNIAIYKKIVPEIFAIGLSATLIQIMTMLQQTFMYRIAFYYGGTDWQTVLGASLRIQAFAFIPLWGISQSFQPIVGTNYGAKEYDRVRRITLTYIGGATLLALLFYIPIQLAPGKILALFINDPAIVAMGKNDFRLMFAMYFLFGLMLISITLFQALGRPIFAGVLAVLRQVLLLLPLVYFLPQISNLGIHGVFLAPAIADGPLAVVCIIQVAQTLNTLSRYKKNNAH